jgi:hypothetical protein
MLREPIAQSTLAHIGRCPRKWFYAVERGLHQRGSVKPMLIGTLFHLTMAAGNHAVGKELAAGVPPSEAFTGSVFLDAARTAAWGAQDDRNGYPLLADLADRKLAMEMVELYFEHIGSKRRYAALLGAEDPVVIDCEGTSDAPQPAAASSAASSRAAFIALAAFGPANASTCSGPITSPAFLLACAAVMLGNLCVRAALRRSRPTEDR